MTSTFPIPPHGRLIVRAILHKIGSQEPYFSITAEEYKRPGQREPVCCGCMHDRIREICGDRFDDLIALHLSEMLTGAPMHAEANAWYWLAGALGGMGENYHGGNSNNTPKPAAECLAIFARHVRVSIDEAQRVVDAARAAAESVPQYTRVYERGGAKAARASMAAWIIEQRPRWAREAGEAIAKHALTVTTR